VIEGESTASVTMPLSFHDLGVSPWRITNRIPNMMPGGKKILEEKHAYRMFSFHQEKSSKIKS
jgi:hypothetical protein